MTIERLKDGRYRIRYYDNGSKSGRRVQENLGKVSAKEAKRIHTGRLANAAARQGQSTGRITFDELSRLYMADQGAVMRGSGRERAEATLEIHLRPVFGHMLVSSIKSTHVRQYQRARLAQNAAPATVNREWNCLRAVLNFGEKEEIIDRNPVRRGAVPPLPTKGGRKDFFEPDEWRAFLAAFEDAAKWQKHLESIRNVAAIRLADDGQTYGVGSRKPDSETSDAYRERLREAVPFFRALLYTATRVGELVTLTWADVDLRRGFVTIHQHKTAKEKTLPIAASLRAVMEALPRGVGSAPVFVRSDGRPFEVRSLQRAFGVAMKLAGVRKPLSIHSVRHTVGSWLTIAGTPERHVAEILGHTQRSVTSGYSHLAQGSLGPILESLQRIEREGFTSGESGSGATLAPLADFSETQKGA